MKGIVCASGAGSRLKPLTSITNKHMLPVYSKPMICYPIQTLLTAGIDDILVVVGGEFTGHFLPFLKDGKWLGIKHLEYVVQDEPRGIAHAVSLAEEWADGENVCVILGDNTTDANLKYTVNSFTEGAKVFLKEVPDPHRFGCPRFNHLGQIEEIVEKPAKGSEPSNFAVTGVYIYDNSIFDAIRTLKPSGRNELEITDANNWFLSRGVLTHDYLNGWWKDCGTFDSLLAAANYWKNKNENNI